MVYTFDLTGKVIVLTGGYGHLGKSVAESLVHHGGTVYVLGRTRNKFEIAFEGHPQVGKKLHFQQCDVAETESIKKAYVSVLTKEDGIDVLINNAFYLDGQDPLSMTDEQWGTGIDGTLSSVFRCIREIIPHIEKSKSPRIINVSSIYGIVAPDFTLYDEFPESLNPPHYGAAKAGIIQLSKYYASYLGNKGITVNTVTPGTFPPEKVQKKERFIELLEKKTALKRIGKPEDLAGAFVYLASDAASYVTGQNIIIDGGWTIQ